MQQHNDTNTVAHITEQEERLPRARVSIDLCRQWRVLLLSWLTLITGLVVGGGNTVGAASPTAPDFKLPLPCRTTWQASTYDWYQGHFHGNALDFNMLGSNGFVEDRGQPVLAAAAGNVISVVASNGEVVIDHGAGWRTRYLHMADIQVRPSQFVSEGQWIGRVDAVSSSGLATGPHLHFEVLRDLQMVKPTIDGIASNVSPSQRVKYTSRNCLSGEHGLWFANSLIRAPDGTVDWVTPSGERYWVPNGSILACLQASGAKIWNVASWQFSANPRNGYGDPAGRWADCTTWTIGWMIKGSDPGVWYVAPNGFRYHVPSDAVVMCLGGWAAVRSVSDSTLTAIPENPWSILAGCETPLYGELVKGSGDPVYYVSPKGFRYHVPSPPIVDCLTGWPQVVDVRDARLNALPENPYGQTATCDAPLLDRMIRKSSGQVDYVGGDRLRFWVPNGGIVDCLGGGASIIFLGDARFEAIPRNMTNAWAECGTKLR